MKEASDSVKIEVSTAELAAFFGVNRRTPPRWKAAGMPQIKPGKWDLKACFDWWHDHIGAERIASQAGDDSLSEAKRLYWWAKSEGEKIKNDREKGLLMERSEIIRAWTMRIQEFKNACFYLQNSLPPRLEGRTQPEMRSIVYDFVWDLFDRVFRTGRFCEVQPQMQHLMDRPKKEEENA